MLALSREMMVGRLVELSAVTDAYARKEPDFPDRAAAWLAAVEKDLGRLRSPLTGLAAAERARILGAEDGLVSRELTGRRATRRRARATLAVEALGRVEAALRERVRALDADLEGAREKLAQLLALAQARGGLPEQRKKQGREAWLDAVWRSLSANGETQGLYGYLAARVGPSDRRYLLGELMENLGD